MSENLTTPILGASSSLIATTAIGKGYVVGFHYDVFFYEDLCTRENTYSPMNGLGILSFPIVELSTCLLYTSPSPRDQRGSRMPSSA